MRALAVFHDHGCHVLDPILKRGFRHCFVAVQSEQYWIRVDHMAGRPVVEVICGLECDLAAFYRQEGFVVVETEQGSRVGFWPLVVANCVGLVKTVLCLDALFAVTPYQLYRRMTAGALLPGKSLFSPSKPAAPPPPPPVVPSKPAEVLLPPERDEPAVADAGRKERLEALRRKGRSASILTSGRGVTTAAPLGRPAAQAGAATLG